MDGFNYKFPKNSMAYDLVKDINLLDDCTIVRTLHKIALCGGFVDPSEIPEDKIMETLDKIVKRIYTFPKVISNEILKNANDEMAKVLMSLIFNALSENFKIKKIKSEEFVDYYHFKRKVK